MQELSIRFFSEDTDFVLEQADGYTLWIEAIIQSYYKICGDINIVFCSDQYLHSINIRYLDHDTFTDIITFDNSEEDHLISGDIFISIDRIKENASIFQQEEITELSRVIIHGILHLIGFCDKSEIEKLEMRKLESECLRSLDKYVPRGT